MLQVQTIISGAADSIYFLLGISRSLAGVCSVPSASLPRGMCYSDQARLIPEQVGIGKGDRAPVPQGYFERSPFLNPLSKWREIKRKTTSNSR